MQMKREDYKAIKHMDKAQMSAYLVRVYQKGYEAGVKAMADQVKAETDKASNGQD